MSRSCQKRSYPFRDATIWSIEPAERRRRIDLKAEPFARRRAAQVDPRNWKVKRCCQRAAAMLALHRQYSLAPNYCGTLTLAVSVVVRLRHEFTSIHIVTDDVHAVVNSSHVFLELRGTNRHSVELRAFLLGQPRH